MAFKKVVYKMAFKTETMHSYQQSHSLYYLNRKKCWGQKIKYEVRGMAVHQGCRYISEVGH